MSELLLAGGVLLTPGFVALDAAANDFVTQASGLQVLDIRYCRKQAHHCP